MLDKGLVQMRAMRGSMLLPILFSFQGEIELPCQYIYHGDDVFLRAVTKAYRMRLILQEIYRYPASIAPMMLQDWIQWGLRCRLDPMVEVAKMLQKHYDGVIRWFTSKLNNGLLEGVNSLFQAAKRKARGFFKISSMDMFMTTPSRFIIQ